MQMALVLPICDGEAAAEYHLKLKDEGDVAWPTLLKDLKSGLSLPGGGVDRNLHWVSSTGATTAPQEAKRGEGVDSNDLEPAIALDLTEDQMLLHHRLVALLQEIDCPAWLEDLAKGFLR
jgi:hypothetical protein